MTTGSRARSFLRARLHEGEVSALPSRRRERQMGSSRATPGLQEGARRTIVAIITTSPTWESDPRRVSDGKGRVGPVRELAVLAVA